MEPLIFFTILIIIFVTVSFLAWYVTHRSKERERLLLLEKGFDPTDLPLRNITFRFPWLKIGIVITSSVIGLIFGITFVELIYDPGSAQGVVIIGMLLFGGIGLIIAHYVDNNS